ncbi:Inosine/uridine-preferring nucleoside hydrolase domain-containing protein [Hysterangium stoloniferum]|nr:Inosine/uridine-preferring nucleoside hydrolase domain-containing protein [Hysterangium stoloniferum]
MIFFQTELQFGVREMLPLGITCTGGNSIDTDPGVDDALAILLALASPELEIKAITINFGNTDVESAYINVLKIWQVLEQHFEKHPEEKYRFPVFTEGYKSEMPFLAVGNTAPLSGEPMFAEYFHGRDGLADISIRHPELSIPNDYKSPFLRLTDRHAVDLSLDILRSVPARALTYIALGPLTNLAQMMRKDSLCIRERIGQVVAMGGALEAPGNVTAVAEFNFYADPFAVQELLQPKDPMCALPLDRFIMIPLDITDKHTFPFPDYKSVVDSTFSTTASPSIPGSKPPLVHFTSSVLERTAEVMRGFGVDAIQLHDPMAMWCAICNPPSPESTSNVPNMGEGWKTRKRTFDIERFGEHTRGMLVVDRREDESNYQPGENRVEAHANSNSGTPTLVNSEQQMKEALFRKVGGVNVVTESPGPHHLVKLMCERIWAAPKAI